MASSLSMRPRRSLPRDLERLKPTLKAYGFGLLSVTLPRLVSLLIAAIRGKVKLQAAVAQAVRAIRRQAAADAFPFSCGLLVFGATFVPRVLAGPRAQSKRPLPRWSAGVTFVSTFVAALVSFALLNRKSSEEERFARARSREPAPPETAGRVVTTEHGPLAGRTLDLTVFGAVRAIDVAVALAWAQYKPRASTGARKLANEVAVPTLFAVSSCIVMWTWFYSPHNLPPSYSAWISSAANIDRRLIQALQECRQGTFVYGEDTGRGYLLEGMARDLEYPEEWGDPARTIPVPCELYHSGTGKSCEWHALSRFARSWAFAMRMYLPLNLALLLRREPTLRSSGRAVMEASRSSAFLGAFVAFFYYGVCLARTRVGPRLMHDSTKARQWLENGPNVATGCALCGWSILVEKAARRQEMAFFVAPRALSTLLPRRYEREFMWREQLVYSASAASVLTASLHSRRLVRGVFGRVLSTALD